MHFTVMTIQKLMPCLCTLWAEAQVSPRLSVSQCDPQSTAFHSGPPFVPICRNKDDLESLSKSGGLAATITYPGGKGPLFMGVILGAGVATDAEEAGPDLGPVAACAEPPAAAAAAETPGSSS